MKSIALFSQIELRLIKIATIIRFFVWTLAFLADNLLTDHEQSIDLLLKANDNEEYSIISQLFKCFVRWDAFFFLDIAKNGYQYFKNHAFFPLFPLSIRYFKVLIFDGVLSFLEFRDIDKYILSGVILNYLFHIAAVIVFYRLTKVYTSKQHFAFKSAIFYCISPASIFYSALYSETLFHLLTFLGLYALYQNNSSDGKCTFWTIFKSSFCFFLATLVRSTGMFYIIFIGCNLLKDMIYELISKNSFSKKVLEASKSILYGIFSLIMIISAYIMVMYYPYKIYCTGSNLNELGLENKPEWCSWKIPNAYTYIQLNFWEVSFMSSYTLKNIFNIYWGLHMLIVFVVFLLDYTIVMLKLNSKKINYKENTIGDGSNKRKDIFYTEKNIPIMIFSLINFIINAFYAYIQCSTRILSANPMIYWYSARYSSNNSNNIKVNEKKLSFRKHWIFYYFIYFLISGSVIFPNFYLFTQNLSCFSIFYDIDFIIGSKFEITFLMKNLNLINFWIDSSLYGEIDKKISFYNIRQNVLK